MKKLLVLLLVLVFAGGGYIGWKYVSGAWEEEMCEGGCDDGAFQEEVEARNDSYPQILFMIDDFSAYSESEKTKIELSCEGIDENLDAVIKTAEEGGIKELKLSYGDEGSYFTLYGTPNIDGLTMAEFDELAVCCGGVGCEGPLKAYETHLVWGYAQCSSGWAPDEDDSRYDDFMVCVEFSEQIRGYLEEGSVISAEDYISDTYGFYIDIPEGYKLVTEGYEEGIVWVGPDSDFWADGFFIKLVDDVDARIEEIKAEDVELIEEATTAIGNTNAEKVIVEYGIGYNVTHYFVEGLSSSRELISSEIQAIEGNKEAQESIMTLFFPSHTSGM
ncbi:MAG: hypothetical protein ABII07_03910 [Patescibacteria group bacterium]|nr:hypothetical protein [Patescibacteria group bacterium]